jgi:uncharacterized glyoxalase superfamily protein PhnB
MASVPVWKIIPFFCSTSIAKTVDFYCNVLQFQVHGKYDHNTLSDADDMKNATFASLSIGPKVAANIYFSVQATPGKAMIAFKDMLKAASPPVEFSDEIEDQPWGYRQFNIKDHDQNELIFFAFLEEKSKDE